MDLGFPKPDSRDDLQSPPIGHKQPTSDYPRWK